MTPDRWEQIKSTFQAAMERRPEEREVWLATETAGDPELRREISKMLRHAGGGGLLDTPAWHGLRVENVLAPGTHLGPYQVEEEIGAGGMGRVYRARDTRLGRTVAIKVLNAEYSDRLQMEGRAVSVLNHPHVCALHDIGNQDGRAYLVMECIEGESLAARLSKGALPLDEVLRYGAEIASALAAAHAQGIVHRDLKPANIMVTAAGVKVLDFGVARSLQEDEPATAGGVVGTAAYMSPSQWNGTPAEARSDVFALGLVLCEMATGKRPPAPLPSGRDSALGDLIGRCIEKDATRRIQSMDEVRAVLERLRSESLLSASRRPRTPVLAAAGLLAVGAIAAYQWKADVLHEPPPPPMVRLPMPEFWPVPSRPQPPLLEAPPVKARSAALHTAPKEPPSLGILASYPGMERDPSFSPDGSKVAFAWQRSSGRGFAIYVRSIPGDDPPVAVTSGLFEDWGPAWSPDGRRIAFRRRDKENSIYWVAAAGGPESFVAHTGRQDQETLPQMSWSRDGKWIAVPDRDAYGVYHLDLIAASTGEKRELTSNDSGMDHAPAFSPDGKSLAYASCRAGAAVCDVQMIVFGAGLKVTQRRTITQQGLYLRGIAWAPDRSSIIYSAGRTRSANTSLYRVPANGTGVPVRIDLAGSDARHPTVSAASDLLAYTKLGSWNLMLIRNFR